MALYSVQSYISSQIRLAKIRIWREEISKKLNKLHKKRGAPKEGGRVDFSLFPDDYWKNHFRFTKQEVYRLADALGLPPIIHGHNRVVEDKISALCMLLVRLHYPARLASIHHEWGWSPERVSYITTSIMMFIYKQWKFTLDFDSIRLTPGKLREYADVITAAGSPLPHCWGFLDGTKRRICRPSRRQQVCYSGHKKWHALAYQAVTTPDGLIGHLYGPIEGRHHDSWMYATSKLFDMMETYAWDAEGHAMKVYGDPGYRRVNRHLISPFQGVNLNSEKQDFNTRMSSLRQAVEFSFHEVVSQFAFIDYYKSQKLLLQPVGIQFIVAVLLHNAHVCLHEPQIAQYFNMTPPQLEEYFHR